MDPPPFKRLWSLVTYCVFVRQMYSVFCILYHVTPRALARARARRRRYVSWPASYPYVDRGAAEGVGGHIPTEDGRIGHWEEAVAAMAGAQPVLLGWEADAGARERE
eukprot:COSAG02_NODE_281_length_25776_cov_37.797998_17_plen_107_part_00